MKGNDCVRVEWPIRPASIFVFSSMRRLGVFLHEPLDGMLAHCKVTPPPSPPPPRIKLASTYLTPGWREAL